MSTRETLEIRAFSIVFPRSRPPSPFVATMTKANGALGIPETEVLQVGAVLIYVVHDLAELDIDPAAGGFHVVVSGHSHQPAFNWRDDVLFINPGSAGPRRFKLPVSVATLTIAHEAITPRLVELNVHSNA